MYIHIYMHTYIHTYIHASKKMFGEIKKIIGEYDMLIELIPRASVHACGLSSSHG